ncbi:MAG: DUF3987 domain-containing protein [Kiritimatiellae bacterium]|nr:DUF3987 domain-containing protein [Kiritimatiellia bacterium]
MASSKDNNALDFQDPGTMSNELLAVPGFINELKDHTLAVAPRPNEPLAFAGALAMLAHLAGRSYVDSRGAHTNLYLAALAPTGMGKDEPRVTNKRLAAAVGILDSVPDAIASGEGLEDAVAASPSLLLQTDEADSLLTAMRGGDSRASKLNEMVLRFFSEAKSGHAMRLKAGQCKAQTIPLPHLTLFATGIPKFVYASLTSKALENGLLGRCLFIESDEFRPLGEMRNEPLPERCVTTAKAMAAREKAFTESGILQPIVVTESPEAKLKIAELRTGSDAIARRLFESDLRTAAALYCRLYEKAMKLALLYAISENPEQPELGVPALQWATRFAMHVTKKMLYESQFNVAEGAFDRLKQRTIGLMIKHGGSMERSTLLKNLHVDAGTLQRILLTLHMCDLIDEDHISGKKVIITLKHAA